MRRALATLLLLFAADAQAETAGLSVVPCAGGPSALEVAQALSLELLNEGVTLVLEGAPADAPRFVLRWVDCGVEVDIELDDPAQATRTTTRVDLADIAPDLRLRALGLTTAELYRALVLERAKPSVAPNQPVVATTPARRRSALGLALLVDSWPSTDLALIGPQLSFVTTPLDAPVGFRFGLAAAFASRTTAFGDVATTSVDVRVGIDLRGASSSLTWSVGPRLGAGLIMFDGASDIADLAGTSGRRGSVVLGLGGELALDIGTRGAFVSLGLDIGMTLVGARAVYDSLTLVEASGPVVGVALGFGWRL